MFSLFLLAFFFFFFDVQIFDKWKWFSLNNNACFFTPFFACLYVCSPTISNRKPTLAALRARDTPQRTYTKHGMAGDVQQCEIKWQMNCVHEITTYMVNRVMIASLFALAYGILHTHTHTHMQSKRAKNETKKNYLIPLTFIRFDLFFFHLFRFLFSFFLHLFVFTCVGPFDCSCLLSGHVSIRLFYWSF